MNKHSQDQKLSFLLKSLFSPIPKITPKSNTRKKEGLLGDFWGLSTKSKIRTLFTFLLVNTLYLRQLIKRLNFYFLSSIQLFPFNMSSTSTNNSSLQENQPQFSDEKQIQPNSNDLGFEDLNGKHIKR